ncbi:putative signal peptide and transmembrane protein [Rhodopirellula islandica]|uniref:Signal peptide and transmembrane protein n=1 Tax=Rhodopirellula islandica TaxID=595434 RepID=A0A0J1B873_RHOIS|nr:hypothetical protein [Rhodopirellula islandica]KLU02907.1 putative signal peptide and transmembrane protein [Rhodopirellula islandica]
MPIQVTCPNCLKRFQVSDKFAGKQGPCPACKKTIRVPDASEAVTIHSPENDGPKDSKGQSVLKPITRKDTDFTRRHLYIAAGVMCGMLFLALGFRFAMGGAPFWAQILGILLLAPPIVRTGYSFVYDAELEPYTGVELRNRVLICSAVFAAIWLVYAFLPAYVLELDHANEMSWTTAGIVFSVMLVLGAFVSVAAFELEFINGLAHSGMYFVLVILLALVAGVKLAGEPGSRRELLPDFEDEELEEAFGQMYSAVPILTCSIESAAWSESSCAAWAKPAGCAELTIV